MSRLLRSRIVLGFAAALGVAVLTAGAQASPTVTLGCDLDPNLKGAVLYRNLGDQGSAAGLDKIRIGRSPLSEFTSGALPTPGWGLGKAITFTYDGVGNLTTAVPGSSPSPVWRDVSSLGSLNYLEITVGKNQSPTSISLKDVSLGADFLGSFERPGGSMGSQCWRVTGVDLGAGFTLTGMIALTGSISGQDPNFVRIDVGFVAPADPPDPVDEVGPVTSNVYVTPDPVLLNGDATVKAMVDDSDTGGSTIASAEYSLDGGITWSPMAAKDSDFDEMEEYVEATFTATVLGENLVCVRGTDALGNMGDPTCQYFLVTYKFDGFFSPIDNHVVNVAKAGQAIPAKWRLTDANDVPIDNPGSFAGLFSSVTPCTPGSPTDPVEEGAAGNSGLQYNGDGYWQFNWKTPKDYANTCRCMYVEFDSGASSPMVKVQFKK